MISEFLWLAIYELTDIIMSKSSISTMTESFIKDDQGIMISNF